MRVTEVPNAGNKAAIKAFIEHLCSIDLLQDVGWFSGEYLHRKITVALIKQALQHMRVPLGGVQGMPDDHTVPVPGSAKAQLIFFSKNPDGKPLPAN